MNARVAPLAGALLQAAACGGGATPAGGAAHPPLAPQVEAQFSRDGCQTNFGRHSVPLAEIRSGGPAKDGIPALDHPKFAGVAGAYRPGTSSALDAASVAEGFDLGASGVSRRRWMAASSPSSQPAPTSWTPRPAAAGTFSAGRYRGLSPGAGWTRSCTAFWFAWAAFKPATRVYR